MFHVTSEIYSKLATELERLVDWHECDVYYDCSDPDSIKDTVEVEADDLLFTIDFTAYPSYSYEEINPGLYAPYDSEFGYVRDGLELDFGKLEASDEDGEPVETDFSADELRKYIS